MHLPFLTAARSSFTHWLIHPTPLYPHTHSFAYTAIYLFLHPFTHPLAHLPIHFII